MAAAPAPPLRPEDVHSISLGEGRNGEVVYLSSSRRHRKQTVDAFFLASRGYTSVEEVSVEIGLRRDQQTRENYFSKWRHLGQGLKNLEGVKSLSLKAHALFPQRPDIYALQQVMKQVPQIRSLSINFSIEQEGDLRAVVNSLQDLHNLQEIEFFGPVNHEAVDSLVYQIKAKKLSSVKYFGLSEPMPDKIISILGMETLEVLDLIRCPLTEGQCQTLADSLSQQISNLKSLSLVSSTAEGPASVAILEALKGQGKIKHLQLSRTFLRQAQCAALADLLSVTNSLEELCLQFLSGSGYRYNDEVPGIDPEWLRPVFASLKSNSSLKKFTADEVEILGEGPAGDLASWLESSTTIANLDLVSQGPAVAWKILMPAIGRSTSLRKVRIQSNINPDQLTEMASLLQSNTGTCLEELQLSYGYSGWREAETDHEAEEEAEAEKAERLTKLFVTFLRALGQNTTLKSFDYMDRKIGSSVMDKSADLSKQMAAALSKNYGICQIKEKLHFSPWSPEALDPILQLNKAGRKYLLVDPANKACGVQVLAAVADSLDAIFFHLLENPSLCDSTAVEQPRSARGKHHCKPKDDCSTTREPKRCRRA